MWEAGFGRSRVWATSAAFQQILPWCRNSGAFFTTVTAGLGGKPALAVAAILGQVVFETLVGVGGGALVAGAYGDKEGRYGLGRFPNPTHGVSAAPL